MSWKQDRQTDRRTDYKNPRYRLWQQFEHFNDTIKCLKYFSAAKDDDDDAFGATFSVFRQGSKDGDDDNDTIEM